MILFFKEREMIAKFVVTSIFLLFAECVADIVILAGDAQVASLGSNQPTYPLADTFDVGEESAVSIAIPKNFQGSVNTVAINSNTGSVIFAGDSYGNSSIPIYRGSVVSLDVERILTPFLGGGVINSVAIGDDGTAVFGGATSSHYPVIYTLSQGSSEVTVIGLPNGDLGAINWVAIGSDGRAVLAGKNDTTGTPLIYTLLRGESSAQSVTLPDASLGDLNGVAITADGRAILGGEDTTSSPSSPLIYSLEQGSQVATRISTPNSGDDSDIIGVAVGPDNSTVLVGSNQSDALIYKLPQGSNAVFQITVPNSNFAIVYCVAIGLDGTAIMGGRDGMYDSPIIYRLAKDSSVATSIPMPGSVLGGFNSVAIGSQNIAVLGGNSGDTIIPIAYAVSTLGGVPQPISIQNSMLEGEILSVAIYNCDGLYDIRRLRPYYYLEKSQAAGILNQ
jgi:hypothetical protein